MVEEEGEPKYVDEIDEQDITDLVDRAEKAEKKNIDLARALGSTADSKKDANFLHHQISTLEIIESLEHFYRGEYKGTNKDGSLGWIRPENKELITFNDFGVSSLMEIVTKYIDKNTILSNYNEQRIFEIMADIGDEMVLLMLCNYEKMGMDTYSKKTKFRIIITTTMHMIESAYRRALRGKTLEEINQTKVIGQFGNPIAPEVRSNKSPNWLSRQLSRVGG